MIGCTEGSARASGYLRKHRTLMGTVIERISSAESGLHEAFMSLLTGFEVREMMYIFDSIAHFQMCPVQIVAPETLPGFEKRRTEDHIVFGRANIFAYFVTGFLIGGNRPGS